ncbi:MAG: CapA family protein [Oscillospiraceae bacterium]|nr:CapA family protein [Oscillospiraceae bacterium]
MFRNNRLMAVLTAALSLILAVLLFTAAFILDRPAPEGPTEQTTLPQMDATQSTTVPPTSVPTDPPITVESTATLSATGDILMHKPVINTGTVTDGEYDFASIFTYFSDYVTAADYAVANLETTLASTNNGYAYSGYPRFNCPDGIVSSAKNAGFDMLLTANNHSYDTQGIGLRRTQQVIAERGLVNLGSKLEADDPNYLVVTVNGINLGLCCYTYEDNAAADQKAPNGITMSSADAPLLNTFDYTNLSAFYEEMQENIALMEEAGADAVVLFIHWGNEYQIKQNSTQTSMAQALCDLGVDVIIGGHPHVVQPVELLTSTTDAAHKTVCLYSMGNAVSNQRIGEMSLKTGHTEDGVLFSVTFTKYSDGTVILSDADLLPTWVDLRSSPKKTYAILPLDKQIEDWKTQFSLTDSTLEKAQKSYDRTMAIVGEGMTQVDTYLTQLKQETEASLGIQ